MPRVPKPARNQRDAAASGPHITQLELQALLFFFSLSFKAETAQRSLTHVIWKYCDNQEIGLVSRETTVAVSFLLFFKSNFDLSSPVRKKFTKYTSVGACVDSGVCLLSDVRDIFPVPCPLPAFGFLPLGLCPMLLNHWDKGFEERVSQFLSFTHLPVITEDRNLSEAKKANLWLM